MKQGKKRKSIKIKKEKNKKNLVNCYFSQMFLVAILLKVTQQKDIEIIQ